MQEMEFDPELREWVGTEVIQEITPQRQIHVNEEFDKRYSYHTKSQTHMWMVMLTHYASDTLLDAVSGDSESTPLLDSDTLAMAPRVGCYICETMFEPILRLRKCPGEPKASVKR